MSKELKDIGDIDMQGTRRALLATFRYRLDPELFRDYEGRVYVYMRHARVCGLIMTLVNNHVVRVDEKGYGPAPDFDGAGRKSIFWLREGHITLETFKEDDGSARGVGIASLEMILREENGITPEVVLRHLEKAGCEILGAATMSRQEDFQWKVS